jgi:polyisoprenoid-binding protein YceI
LTIKGTTRPVTAEFVYTGSAVDPYGNTRIGFEGISTINRSDFGITFNADRKRNGAGSSSPRGCWATRAPGEVRLSLGDDGR